MMLRDYRCHACGETVEHLLGRDEPAPPCACGGELEPVISGGHVRVPLVTAVSMGRSDKPPPGAMDTRPLAEGQPYAEWRADRKKVHDQRRRDRVHQVMRER